MAQTLSIKKKEKKVLNFPLDDSYDCYAFLNAKNGGREKFTFKMENIQIEKFIPPKVMMIFFKKEQI